MGEWNEDRPLSPEGEAFRKACQEPEVREAWAAMMRGDYSGLTDMETPAPKLNYTGNRKARRAKAKGNEQ